MEPKIIGMIVEPQDIILELIKRRSSDLQAKNPELKGNFEAS